MRIKRVRSKDFKRKVNFYLEIIMNEVLLRIIMNEFMNSYPCDKEMNEEENFKRNIHYFLEIIMSKVLNI